MPSSAPPRDAVSVIAQEFLVDDPCSLSVHVPGARIRLRPGSDPDRVEIDISVTGCPPEEAEDILDRMQVGTRQMKDTVHVYSDSDRSDAEWWRWVRTLDVEIHVDLRLPGDVEADIRAPGGAVDVADLRGRIDVNVMGGPCRAENLEGTLDIRAESSEVTIEDVTGDEVVARVAVGSLTLTDVETDTITVRSVAAPLSLRGLTGATTVSARSASVDLEDLRGPCTARVHGGRLALSGPPSDEVTLRVVGASLDASVPPDHGADLHMRGPDLSLADGFSFEGERTGTEIEGTLNGGGPPLTLEAVGGGRVRCRPS
jgi:hypothetical protein